MGESDKQISPYADIVNLLCQKLNCSDLSEDLVRVDHASEMLAKSQQKKALSLFLGASGPASIGKDSQKLLKNPVKTDFLSNDTIEEEGVAEKFEVDHCDDLSCDSWLGFFKSYEILSEDQRLSLNENKQCIEISHNSCDSSLDTYLRSGVRCFMIDLFKGTELENQRLIFKLRESELKISREYGFAITVTLFAMLSPRCQYTGVLESSDADTHLKAGENITLTTNRGYSLRGNRSKIYVNARFLIHDCRCGDFILIGPTIQVQIVDIDGGDLCCLVMESGYLRSRLPVRFPGRCDRFSISVEELEDITFAREVGISVLVSYIFGTIPYLEDLKNTLRLLNFENSRICCRIVLNEIQDDNVDLHWVAEQYDGFIIEFSSLQRHDKCLGSKQSPVPEEVLHFSPQAVQLMQKVFQLRKSIVMNPTIIADRQLCVHPSNMKEIFYCPDKYMFKCDKLRDSFYFYLLQNAYFMEVAQIELSTTPYCDKSHTGSDSIARSCVAASFESDAAAILVCSIIPNMPIKLSHFRPKAPIIYISSLKSTDDYISMYHNIIHLYFRGPGCSITHEEFVTKSLLFGLIFLKCRKMVKQRQNVMLVYSSGGRTKFPDKYMVYKFDEETFSHQLSDVLFN